MSKASVLLCMVLSGLAGVVFWAPARAQSTGGLEQVIVTAERRSESLQSVPMSITALSGDALQREGAVQFFDYATEVPNLGFGFTGIGLFASRSVSIRGISGDNTTGFYIDDTPVPDYLDPRILDVDRVEVLRGPQGTLYGARSMGGTVRIISRTPDLNHFSADVDGQLGYTDGAVKPNVSANGVVNLPLVPGTSSLRVSAFFDRRAGFFRRQYCKDPASAGVSCIPGQSPPEFFSTLTNIAQQDVYGAAAQLEVKLSDAWSITPRVMYQRTEMNGMPYSDIYLPASGTADYTPRSFVQSRYFNVPEGGYQRWGLFSVDVKYHTDLGDFTSATSYFDSSVVETENATEWTVGVFGTPPISTVSTQRQTIQRAVEELRFVSAFTGPVQLTAGLFFEDTRGHQPLGNFDPMVVPGLNALFGGELGTDLMYAQEYYSREDEIALYGELNWHITPKWLLTAGARAYSDKNASHDWIDGIVVAGSRVYDPYRSFTERGVNPKVLLEYQVGTDQLVYASAARGFRPGGVLPAIPTSSAIGCGPNLVALGLTAEQTRTFDSDHLWNYELGAKKAWLDNAVTLNVAAFHIDWKNIQQRVVLPCGFFFVGNAGGAKVDGTEVELRARLARGLELDLGAGYEDARISAAGATSPQQIGSPVYQVPPWTGTAALNYTRPLTGSLSLESTLRYAYVGQSYSANNVPSNPRLRPPYAVTDATLGVVFGNYRLRLIGSNLFNVHANLADNYSDIAETPGRPRIVVNQPRTLALDLSASF